MGTTPIVKIAGRGWKKVSAVGVLTLSPGVTRRDGNVVRRRVGQHFTLHEGDIDGERCAACLRDLLRHVRGQVVLLWDGLAVHRAPACDGVPTARLRAGTQPGRTDVGPRQGKRPPRLRAR